MTDTRSTERRETAARSVALLLGVLCISAVLVGLTAAQSANTTDPVNNASLPVNYSDADVNSNRASYSVSNDSIVYQNAEWGGGHYSHIEYSEDIDRVVRFSMRVDQADVSAAGRVYTGFAKSPPSNYSYNSEIVGLVFKGSDGGSAVNVDLYDGQDSRIEVRLLDSVPMGTERYYNIWITDGQLNAEAYSDANRTDLIANASTDIDNTTGFNHYYPTSAGFHETNQGTAQISGEIQTDDTMEPFRIEPISLKVDGYMRPNTTQYYTVVSGSGDDVTNETSVTSQYPSFIAVNESNHSLRSAGINGPTTVSINASWEGSSDSKDVTVAEPNIANLDHLPVWWKVNATLGDGMMLWLIVASLLAVVGTRAASPFAGIGCYVLTLAAGWIAGPVSDGVMVAAILAGLFLGLNVAANVDTSIRS